MCTFVFIDLHIITAQSGPAILVIIYYYIKYSNDVCIGPRNGGQRGIEMVLVYLSVYVHLLNCT